MPFAELMLVWIKEIGARKISALVTDNAPNMVKARRIVVGTAGCTHIVELRFILRF